VITSTTLYLESNVKKEAYISRNSSSNFSDRLSIILAKRARFLSPDHEKPRGFFQNSSRSERRVRGTKKTADDRARTFRRAGIPIEIGSRANAFFDVKGFGASRPDNFIAAARARARARGARRVKRRERWCRIVRRASRYLRRSTNAGHPNDDRQRAWRGSSHESPRSSLRVAASSGLTLVSRYHRAVIISASSPPLCTSLYSISLSHLFCSPLSVRRRSLDHCACSFRVLYRAAPARKMWGTRRRTCARVFSAVNRSIGAPRRPLFLAVVGRARPCD